MRVLTDFLWRQLNRWIRARELESVRAASAAEETTGLSADLFELPGQKFLHVGCGLDRKPAVGPALRGEEWREIRLDIDPMVDPDIVANMLDMSIIPTASVEAVYSSHNIEHLYPHEVPVALAEFLRVLKPDGFLLLTCPDLQSICRLVVEDKIDQPAYMSAAGPITPLDVLFGYRPRLTAGKLHMAHHTGFTLRTLVESTRAVGFRTVAGARRERVFELWVLATKTLIPEEQIQHLAAKHFPR